MLLDSVTISFLAQYGPITFVHGHLDIFLLYTFHSTLVKQQLVSLLRNCPIESPLLCLGNFNLPDIISYFQS